MLKKATTCLSARPSSKPWPNPSVTTTTTGTAQALGSRRQGHPLASRIINIADTFEVLIDDGCYILDQRENILAAIDRQSGRQFDPTLVKAVSELANQESFWFDLATPQYYDHFFRSLQSHGQVRLNIQGLLDAAEIFATIVDRTSRFTATHSRTVAAVASFLAHAKGYSDTEVKIMRVAGLLHDLGKLTVPNHILEKPGKLTPANMPSSNSTPTTPTASSPRSTTSNSSPTGPPSTTKPSTAPATPSASPRQSPSRLPHRRRRRRLRRPARRSALPFPLPAGEVEKIMLGMAADRHLDADIVKTLLEAGDAALETGSAARPALA
jgi:hypothetical protein